MAPPIGTRAQERMADFTDSEDVRGSQEGPPDSRRGPRLAQREGGGNQGVAQAASLCIESLFPACRAPLGTALHEPRWTRLLQDGEGMFQGRAVRVAAGLLVGGTIGVLLAVWLFESIWAQIVGLDERASLYLLLKHMCAGVGFGMIAGVAAAWAVRPFWTAGVGFVGGVAAAPLARVIGEHWWGRDVDAWAGFAVLAATIAAALCLAAEVVFRAVSHGRCGNRHGR
jgi:hypothetical protein